MKKNCLFKLIFVLILQSTFSQTIVQMEKVNGVYQIPCKVNGIEMKFIFDTGASNISISKTEASFLAKQGLLKEDDIIGTQKFRIADGSITEGTKIIIREIKLGDIFINDVSATVIDNNDAPLLFGQSALSKFGRFEIEKDILRIYPTENRNNLEFLGIDLTKTIDDFGLSRSNLTEADPVIGIPFEVCNVSEEHELKGFGFETQFLIFDRNAKIVSVGLTKESKGKSNIEKEKFAKDFFEDLYREMSLKFGSTESKMSKSAQWYKRNFDLMIGIESDHKVTLLYIPRITVNPDLIIDNNSENKEYVKNEQEIPETADDFYEELRDNAVKTMNTHYESMSTGKWRLNAYRKNTVIYLSMESDTFNIDTSLYTKKKRKNNEQTLSKNMAYKLYEMYFGSKKEDTLEYHTSLWSKIVFNFYWTYLNGTTSSIEYSISADDMLKIGIPVTKQKFDKYCK